MASTTTQHVQRSGAEDTPTMMGLRSGYPMMPSLMPSLLPSRPVSELLMLQANRDTIPFLADLPDDPPVPELDDAGLPVVRTRLEPRAASTRRRSRNTVTDSSLRASSSLLLDGLEAGETTPSPSVPLLTIALDAGLPPMTPSQHTQQGNRHPKFRLQKRPRTQHQYQDQNEDPYASRQEVLTGILFAEADSQARRTMMRQQESIDLPPESLASIPSNVFLPAIL